MFENKSSLKLPNSEPCTSNK